MAEIIKLNNKETKHYITLKFEARIPFDVILSKFSDVTENELSDEDIAELVEHISEGFPMDITDEILADKAIGGIMPAEWVNETTMILTEMTLEEENN